MTKNADNKLPEAIALNSRVKSAFQKFRKLRGFNQVEMATLIGVGEDTYQKWENPKSDEDLKRAVPLFVLLRFCQVFGYDVYAMSDGDLVPTEPKKLPRRRKAGIKARSKPQKSIETA